MVLWPLYYVFFRITASGYPFDIFKSVAIVLSVFFQIMASDYPFDIFKPLVIVLSVFLWNLASGYLFVIYKMSLYFALIPLTYYL